MKAGTRTGVDQVVRVDGVGARVWPRRNAAGELVDVTVEPIGWPVGMRAAEAADRVRGAVLEGRVALAPEAAS